MAQDRTLRCTTVTAGDKGIVLKITIVKTGLDLLKLSSELLRFKGKKWNHSIFYIK